MSKIVSLFGGGSANSKAAAPDASGDAALAAFLTGYSLEVMPRTAAKAFESGAPLPPSGARVYIAHLDGTSIEDMRETAKELVARGYEVMPHIPARIVKDAATLEQWISAYADLGVSSALVLAGGVTKPIGDFHSSMQLLETGLFDKYGFKRLHVAGHPEGNKDIDPDGSDKNVADALRWKQAFTERTDAEMAIATQFAFESGPIIEWVDRLGAEGIALPVHIGVAGPAKLQTLIKFSIACGVGPSLRVLQRRALDMTKLLLPFEPTDILSELAAHKAANPSFGVESVHFFPLGGIKASVEWAEARRGAGDAAAQTA